MTEDLNKTDLFAINEVQLILAEKRTSLAVLRTGIAVTALPLSILGALIATSDFYDVFKVMYFLIPLVVLNLSLLSLGVYLIFRSIIKMRHYDQIICKIKMKHSVLAEFIK